MQSTTTRAERRFVLCGDDYALTEGVSRAMLGLVDARRLTAVSAMSSMPAWPEHAGELRSRRRIVAIGVHLDLTLRPFAERIRPFGLAELILRSLSGQLDASAIAVEFDRQLDLFETALGAAPDHVDGHHHVHRLPQVREALSTVLLRRYGELPADSRPLIRTPTDALRRILKRRGARAKALTVSSLCAGFREQMSAAGFATNRGFAGFSQYAGRKRLHQDFDAFLNARGPRHLAIQVSPAQLSRSSIRSPEVVKRNTVC